MLYETRVLVIDISWMGIHLGRGNKTVQMSSLSKLKYTGNEEALDRAVESQRRKGEQQRGSGCSGSCTQVEIRRGCREQAQTFAHKKHFILLGAEIIM